MCDKLGKKYCRGKTELTTLENTITYYNSLFVTPKFCISIVFHFSLGHFNSQEKLKTMLKQNFGVTNKEHYGMLWYFLKWSVMFVELLEPTLVHLLKKVKMEF